MQQCISVHLAVGRSNGKSRSKDVFNNHHIRKLGLYVSMKTHPIELLQSPSEEVRHACTRINHYKFSALMSLWSRDNVQTSRQMH